MSNFKKKIAKIIVILFLINILIFNFITTENYATTINVDTAVNAIDLNSQFNYKLQFGETMLTADFEMEYDPKYISFVSVDGENIDYNEVEKGKIIFLYVDESGKGTESININFKINSNLSEQEITTIIKANSLNAYSLTKGKAYSSKDFNLENSIMTIKINHNGNTPNTDQDTEDDNNQNPGTDNGNNQNPGTNNDSNQEQGANNNNQNSGSDNNNNDRQPNNGNNGTPNSSDNVGAVTNNNSNNNSSVTIATPNSSDSNQAKKSIPFAGNKVSIVSAVLLIIILGHSIYMFAKYHKKETGIFMIFVAVLIVSQTITSNAVGNIFIKKFNRIKNFENIIVIMPDLQNKNVKYSEFVTLQNNNLNVVQIRNKNGDVIKSDDYISTGDIIYSSEKINYKTVVYGDVNSDGNVNSNDIAEILVHKLNNVELEGVVRKAANLYNPNDINDYVIDSNDINVFREYILRKLNNNLVLNLPEELPEGLKIVAEKTSMKVGEEQTLTFQVIPSDKVVDDIEWSSSDEEIATIDENGKLTAKEGGTVQITAVSKSDSQLSDTIEIVVEKNVKGIKFHTHKLEMEVGDTKTIGISIDPPDAQNQEVYFSTSDSKIASVDRYGKITALEEGKVKIIVTTVDGNFSDTCEITITEEEYKPPRDLVATGIVISKTSTRLSVGESELLSAFVEPPSALDQTVFWESSNPDIVKVEQDGKITAKKYGKAIITVTSNDGGFKATCEVTVNPIKVTGITLNKTKISLSENEEETLIAHITPTDATNQSVIWSTSNSSIATVDSNGKVKAISTGVATITVKTRDGGYTESCTVQVIPTYVTGIELDKSEVNILIGETETVTATIKPDNASNKNVIWESSNEDVARVNNYGRITAVAEGTAIITAKTADGNYKATCTVNVRDGRIPVTGVIVNKTAITLTVGSSEIVYASAIPSNATDRRIMSHSSDEDIATTTSSGRIVGISPGKTTVIFESVDGGYKAYCEVTVVEATVHVEDVVLNKEELTLERTMSEKLVATVIPNNAVNKKVTWESDNTLVATVDQQGNVVAKTVGEATITVTTEDGNHIATCKVIVTPIHVKEITLNKSSITLSKGESETVIPTINPIGADNTNITWKSSNEKVATVDKFGKITAVSTGEATITVTTEDGNHTADVKVIVSAVRVTGINLDKKEITLDKNETETLIATVEPEDAGNKNIIWESSNTDIAIVDENGIVTAKLKGEATIIAKSEDGEYIAECKVTVNPPKPESVKLNKTTITLRRTESETLVATVEPEDAENKNVTWESTDTDIVQVDGNGRITAKAIGEATIIVKTEEGEYTAECKVKVIPPRATGVLLNKTEITLDKEETETLIATVMPKDAENTNVTWESEDSNIAEVNEDGTVTAKSVGETIIIVRAEDGGYIAECKVIVNPPKVSGVTLNRENIVLDKNETETLIATVEPEDAGNKNVIWESSNTDIVEVDENGTITAKSTGEATIIVKTEDGEYTAECIVTVNPVRPTSVRLNKETITLSKNETETLIATVEPEDAENKNVIWKTSNSAIAEIDENGKVTAKATGKAIISVETEEGGYLARCEVIVSATRVTGVTLNKENITLDKNETETLTATINPTDADNKNVVWESSNTEIAEIDENGQILAKTAGTVTITVRTIDGDFTATCSVTVRPTEPTGIEIDKDYLEMFVGDEETLTATIRPEDADNKNVLWSSSDSEVATVSNGKITAIKAGETIIMAKTADGEHSVECRVVVKNPPVLVTGISLNKTSLLMFPAEEETLIATITPENAENKNVIWNSSNPEIAEVDENGKVTAKTPGTTVVTVKTEDGNHTARCIVTVLSLELDKNDVQLEVGEETEISIIVTPSTAMKSYEIEIYSGNIVDVFADGTKFTIRALKAGKTKVGIIVSIDGKEYELTCDVEVTESTIPEEPTVELSATQVELNPNEETEIEVKVTSAETYEWEARIENSNIAGIEKRNGKIVITGKTAGTTKLTVVVTINGKEYTVTCDVIVTSTEETKVSLSKTNLELNIGDSEEVSVIVTPSATFSWKANSENGNVIELGNKDGKIVITAKAKGTATVNVIVTVNGKEYIVTCDVVVTSTEETKVNLSKTNLELNVGDVEEISVIVTPSATFSWQATINNSSVAAISKNNGKIVITGKQAGTAKLTVVVTVDEIEYTLTCDITVKDNSVPEETKVILSKTDVELNIGDTETISIIVTPSATFSWEAKCDNSISVDLKNSETKNNEFVLEGKQAGTAKITVTVTVDGKEYQQVCNVVVKGSQEPEEINVSLSKTKLELAVGETSDISVIVTNNKAYTCKVNYEGYVSMKVDEETKKIQVTGEKEGTTTAVFTVTVDDKTYVLNCDIVVKEATQARSSEVSENVNSQNIYKSASLYLENNNESSKDSDIKSSSYELENITTKESLLNKLFNLKRK